MIIPKLDLEKHYKYLDSKSKQFGDIKRFDSFSQGYLGYDKIKDIISDVRYSVVPNESDGLWGIKIIKDSDYHGHVKWVENRSDYNERWARFSKMLFGDQCKKLNE